VSVATSSASKEADVAGIPEPPLRRGAASEAVERAAAHRVVIRAIGVPAPGSRRRRRRGPKLRKPDGWDDARSEATKRAACHAASFGNGAAADSDRARRRCLSRARGAEAPARGTGSDDRRGGMRGRHNGAPRARRAAGRSADHRHPHAAFRPRRGHPSGRAVAGEPSRPRRDRAEHLGRRRVRSEAVRERL
jgi:hypothetical protein